MLDFVPLCLKRPPPPSRFCVHIAVFFSGFLLRVGLRIYLYRLLCLLSAFRLFVLRFTFTRLHVVLGGFFHFVWYSLVWLLFSNHHFHFRALLTSCGHRCLPFSPPV